MTIFEYDEKKHISQEKQESWEEGVLYGRECGIEIGRSMAQEEIRKLQERLRQLEAKKQSGGDEDDDL